MATMFVGSFVRHGALSIAGGLSLLCFAAIALPLVAQSDEVNLEPGAVHLRSWWSILQEKPGEEILLKPESHLYRDSFGRIFVDHREVRLYFGLGWNRLARWFDRSGLNSYDDQADLATRGTLLGLALRARWPIGLVLYVTALLVVWIEPEAFSGMVLAVGSLLLIYQLVFHGRKLSSGR